MRSGSEKLPGRNEPDMCSTWAPPSLLCSPKPPVHSPDRPGLRPCHHRAVSRLQSARSLCHRTFAGPERRWMTSDADRSDRPDRKRSSILITPDLSGWPVFILFRVDPRGRSCRCRVARFSGDRGRFTGRCRRHGLDGADSRVRGGMRGTIPGGHGWRRQQPARDGAGAGGRARRALRKADGFVGSLAESSLTR
jgi:hypothetical protein